MSIFGKNKINKKNSGKLISGRKLILPLVLEDGRVPRLMENVMIGASLLIIIALIWASWAQIREKAMVSGQVVPSGSIKMVHHLEGGIVENVLVETGTIVKKGQPLIFMHRTAANSELNQVKLKIANFSLQKIRLKAQEKAQTPDFGKLGKKYPKHASEQLQLYLANAVLNQREEKTLLARIRQKETEITSLGREIQSQTRHLAILNDQVQMLTKLQQRGYTTRSKLNSAKAGYEKMMTEIISYTGRLATAREQLVEAHSQYDEWRAKKRSVIAEESANVAAELAEMKQVLARQKDLVDRLELQAPVHGIVQNLTKHGPGEVIKPGEIVAEVLPLNDGLVIEVKLEPRHIGHVKVGSRAEIKLTSYDSSIYGVITGKVQKISPTTFQNKDGQSYYKAIIKLAHNYVEGLGAQHMIMPGMEVQADILTGSKSIMKYLLKPVYNTLDAAFSER